MWLRITTIQHTVLMIGMSPFEVLHGRSPPLPPGRAFDKLKCWNDEMEEATAEDAERTFTQVEACRTTAEVN